MSGYSRGYGGGYNQPGMGPEPRGGASAIVGAVSQLSQMGTPESHLALNILSSVLSSDGLPAPKMRRMDMDGPPSRQFRQAYRPPGPGPAPRVWDNQPLQYGKRGRDFDSFSGGGDFAPVMQGRGGRGGGGGGGFQNRGGGMGRGMGMGMRKAQPRVQRGPHVPPAKKKFIPKEKKKETPKKKKEEEKGKGEDVKTEVEEGGEAKPVDKEIAKEGGKPGDKEMTFEDFAPKKHILRCHMCVKDFASQIDFSRHLDSMNHSQISKIYQQKSGALFDLLKSQAKLASQRNIVKTRKLGQKGPMMRCEQCQCYYVGYHKKTREHILCSRHQKCRFCNIQFNNIEHRERHGLTQTHRKKEAEEEQKRRFSIYKHKLIKPIDTRIPETVAMRNLHAAVNRIMKKHSQRQGGPNHMLPYDPNVPSYLNQLKKKTTYRCKVCPGSIQSPKDVIKHYRSRSHYDNFVAHLMKEKAEQDNKEKDKEKLEARAKRFAKDNKDNKKEGEVKEEAETAEQVEEEEEPLAEEEEEEEEPMAEEEQQLMAEEEQQRMAQEEEEPMVVEEEPVAAEEEEEQEVGEDLDESQEQEEAVQEEEQEAEAENQEEPEAENQEEPEAENQEKPEAENQAEAEHQEPEAVEEQAAEEEVEEVPVEEEPKVKTPVKAPPPAAAKEAPKPELKRRVVVRGKAATTPAKIPVKAPTPAVKAPTPAVKAPTPAVKAPTPAVKAPTTAVKAPTPAVKATPVKAPAATTKAATTAVKATTRTPARAAAAKAAAVVEEPMVVEEAPAEVVEEEKPPVAVSTPRGGRRIRGRGRARGAKN